MRSAKYWLKHVGLPDKRLPKAAYETVQCLPTGKRRHGPVPQRHLLQYGSGIVWLSQDVADKRLLLLLFSLQEQRLISCNAQDCHDKTSTKERFQTCRMDLNSYYNSSVTLRISQSKDAGTPQFEYD